MRVNLSPKDLNLSFCPPHLANTYAYGVIIALRVCGSGYNSLGAIH